MHSMLLLDSSIRLREQRQGPPAFGQTMLPTSACGERGMHEHSSCSETKLPWLQTSQTSSARLDVCKGWPSHKGPNQDTRAAGALVQQLWHLRAATRRQGAR